MKLNFSIVSLFCIFSFAKSDYFYYDENIEKENKILDESYPDLIDNVDIGNQFINSYTDSLEPLVTQTEKTYDKSVNQTKENLKIETTLVDINHKIVEELHESTTPLNNINVITDSYQIDDIIYYDDYINENNQELIPSKETILENKTNKTVENKEQNPQQKKSFKFLYIFVPVATIVALILVVSLSVFFKKIAIKKQKDSADHIIYSKVANEIPKV